MAIEEGRHEYLVGLFRTKDAAEEAYEDLREAGYTRDEINVIMSNETRDRYYTTDKEGDTGSDVGNKAMEGMGAGASIGGIVGGIAGAIFALGSNLVIPGLGLVIAGPIAGALAGLGAGGLAGGIVGALIGAGVPKDRAEHINQEVKSGKIMLSVKPHNFDDVVRFTRKWEQQENAEVYA
jgi:hypothetical protein